MERDGGVVFERAPRSLSEADAFSPFSLETNPNLPQLKGFGVEKDTSFTFLRPLIVVFGSILNSFSLQVA